MNHLIIDSHHLCYASLHSGFNELSEQEQKTIVIFDFLKQIYFISNMFPDFNSYIFCWDSKKSYRSVIDKCYKLSRRTKINKLTDEERYQKIVFFKQIDLIRDSIIPDLGFKNSFIQNGYEADDIIAKIVKDRINDKFIIVSTDADLYQLLDGERVRIYNRKKKKILNESFFVNKYHTTVDKWSLIKAIAGCSSDEIKGVKGIGEITAIKYIKGRKLNKGLAEKIFYEKKNWFKNLQLTHLPFNKDGFKQLREFNIVEDELDLNDFVKVFDDYRMMYFLNNISKWKRVFNLNVNNNGI